VKRKAVIQYKRLVLLAFYVLNWQTFKILLYAHSSIYAEEDVEWTQHCATAGVVTGW